MGQYRPSHRQFASGESLAAQWVAQEIILHDANTPFALRSAPLQPAELPGCFPAFEFFSRTGTDSVVGLSFFQELPVGLAIESPVGSERFDLDAQFLLDSIQAARDQPGIVRRDLLKKLPLDNDARRAFANQKR